MTRVSVPQVAFTSGEISPLLHRRMDYQRHQTGLRSCRGFLPLRQGAITRAPGTIHRGNTRGNLPARLVDFEFAENDALTLEFTDLKMRVWRYGQPVLSGLSPYELTTPFPASSLSSLQWVQTADVIWITDGLRPVQKLSRFALNNWTIAAANFKAGPFRVQNVDIAKTLQASATSGAITLTANHAFFGAAHIGSLIRLKAVNNLVPLWTGNTAVTVGQKMRYGGRTYELTAGTTTGVNPPTHSEGSATVSLNPFVTWKALDEGVGIVQVTAVASATSASAQVVQLLPEDVVSSATYRWEEGAWSQKYGYPSLLAVYEQRLVAAANPSEPRAVWFSTAGAFDDFTPGVEADSAFAYTIAGQSSVNRIVWLKGGKSGLHIGALGEEYSTRSSDRGQAIGPATANFGLDGSLGARPGVRPIAPDGRPIFISRDMRRVFEIAYSFQEDANQSTELSLPADHLGDDGFAEIVWQSAPLRMAWLRRGSGELAAMIHEPSQEVLGWAPYSLAGGAVESMSVSTDAAGVYDVLTMVVRRTISGATVRAIEEMALPYGILSGAQPIYDAVHLFAASVFVLGAPTSVFALPHLIGEEVIAWTDGGQFGPLTVDPAGNVTLPASVTKAVIGLFDDTHVVETLDLLGQAPDGSTMGRQRRLSPQVKVGLHRTAAGTVQAVERELGQPDRLGDAVSLIPRAVASDLTTAYSGVAPLPVTSGHAPELSLRFRPVGGAPLTITGLVPPVSEAGI